MSTFWKRDKQFWENKKTTDTFSFVHINKCGGSSVERALEIKQMHFTAEQAISMIGIEKWKEQFTFSITRHPYMRVASLYSYKKIKNIEKMYFQPIDINDWVIKCFKENDKFYAKNKSMLLPCWSWITVDGKVAVDKVIELDDLNDEWEDLCKHIGCEYTPLGRVNTTRKYDLELALSVLNKTSIRIINDYFKEDFDNLNYGYK